MTLTENPPQTYPTDIPATLAGATEDFKSAMRVAHELIVNGTARDAGIQAPVNRACDQVSAQLRWHIAARPAAADELGAYVFRETYPYFSLSPLIARSYTKPRGYAGDYLTLQMVYDDRPVGTDRLGRHIDRWFLGIPASRAVKNRRRLLRDVIVDIAHANTGRRTEITSLACGPAREVLDVLGEAHRRDINATCVDADNEALAYAQSAARRAGVADQVTFAQANIVRAALGRETLELRDQDLVYSIGLIDYLRDGVVVALLDWIYDRLRPGGTAIVGNFDVGNPDKAFMDHVLHWRLVHRSAEDLVALFAASKFGPARVEVRTEDTGINLFAITHR
ncbi:MAG: class I SAM-dependent methyltransferase [Mycobacterium sp.]|nr:class I SAM-dependent methyltransferase [Mycobacterium sp.]